MIRVLGDRHGDVRHLLWLYHEGDIDPGDDVIICGDFGMPWPADEEAEGKLQTLQGLGIRFWICLGNHDWWDRILSMPLNDDGTYTCEYRGRTYDRIRYVAEPMSLDICGRHVLFIPGADSHDIDGGVYPVDVVPDDYTTGEEFFTKNANAIEFARKQAGYEHFRLIGSTWWEAEKTDFDTLAYVTREPTHYDLVISHDGPHPFTEQAQIGRSFLNRYAATDAERMLGEYYERLDFDHWYFGHFHNDLSMDGSRIACIMDALVTVE